MQALETRPYLDGYNLRIIQVESIFIRRVRVLYPRLADLQAL